MGFPPGRVPNNYYALFGIPLFEPDTKLIAQLADNMLAHVRQIRPGEHAAEWTELLDTIRNAKEWLCDPEKKKIYDQQLEAGNVTSLHFVWPIEAKDLEKPSRPLPSQESGRADAARVPELRPSFAKDAGERVLPVTHTFAPSETRPFSFTKWLSVVGRLAAIVFLVLAIVVTYHTLRPRMGWVTLLLASSSGGNDSTSTEQPARLSMAMPPDEAEKSNPPKKGGVLRPDKYPRESSTPPTQSPDNTPAAGTEENGVQKPDLSSQNSSSSSASPQAPPATENSTSSKPVSMESEESLPQNPSAISSQTATGRAPNSADRLQASDESANPPGSNDLPEEFRTTLNQVWESLAQRDVEGARAALNRLASQVRSDSHRRVVEALDQLVQDVEQFWKVMADVVASLQSAEEIAVGDTYVIVVEATRDSLVLRAAGQNRRYALRDIPTILVETLARRRLQPGPDSDILLAAFLAVDPKGDFTEAQRLLERARAQGGDVELIAEALRYKPNAGSGAGRLPVPASGAEVLEADNWLEQQFGARIKQIGGSADAQALARDLMTAAENSALAPAVRYRLLREVLRLAETYGLADAGINAIDRLSKVFQIDFWMEVVHLAESWAGHRFRPTESQNIAKILLPLVNRALRENCQNEARRLAQAGLVLARQSSNIGLIRQYLSILEQLPGEKAP